MVDAGFVTPDEIERAAAVPAVPETRPSGSDAQHYFADWVIKDLDELVGAVDTDIEIVTTLDPRLQRAAEAEMRAILDGPGAERDASQAALVVLDRGGAVLALAGGGSYGASAFNRATQARRQPGSAFKPLVYLAALEAGWRPTDTVADAPIDIAGWTPTNFSGAYDGPVTLTDALARSLNTPAVRLAQAVGVDRVVSVARRLGIESPLGRDLSLALGTSEVTLLELTGAYAAIADGGIAASPYAVVEIRDTRGRVLYRQHDLPRRDAVRAWHAGDLTGMLAAAVESGTGRNASLPGHPVAGKTGTSQGHRDAWFVGFSGQRVAGVWIGNDDNTPMDGVTGGSLPARLWQAVMVEAHRGLDAVALASGSPLRLADAGGPIDLSAPPPPPSDRADDPLGRLIDSLTGGSSGDDGR